MGETDKEDDSLAIELYRNTMTGQWKKVVEMYEEHQIKAISAKINTSGDTALHLAVSIAPEEKVRHLVRVIKDWYNKEVEKFDGKLSELDSSVLIWIKNNEGNTPLHVAASTGRLQICFLLYVSFHGLQLLGVRNKEGANPLFLAAFHGHKMIFLCLRLIFLLGNINPDLESIDSSCLRRNDGETILHCAIRWEYFGEHFLLTFFASPIK